MTTVSDSISYEVAAEVATEHSLPRQGSLGFSEVPKSVSDQPEGSLVGHRKSRSSRDSRSSFHAEIERGFERLQIQLQREQHRAEDAEKRAEGAERRFQEVVSYLKVVNEERLLALREAGRAKEELKLVFFFDLLKF